MRAAYVLTEEPVPEEFLEQACLPVCHLAAPRCSMCRPSAPAIAAKRFNQLYGRKQPLLADLVADALAVEQRELGRNDFQIICRILLCSAPWKCRRSAVRT